MENEIHIRSNHKGKYLNPAGTWSGLRSDARMFRTATEARNWCVQACLANVEILVVRDALICMRVPVLEKQETLSADPSSTEPTGLLPKID